VLTPRDFCRRNQIFFEESLAEFEEYSTEFERNGIFFEESLTEFDKYSTEFDKYLTNGAELFCFPYL
jgi:hypothetical protein